MRCWTMAVLGLALLLPLVAAGQEPDPTVRITNGEWPPYLGSEEPGFGIASRIVTRAFERAGYDVEYEFYPWSRSLYLARNGQRDGTAVWMPSDERRENFHISEPVLVTEYVFFHRKAMPFEWDGVRDLAGYRIGLTRDYDYGRVIERVRRQGIAPAETVSADRLNFLKLLAGRIDLFPMDRVVGQRMINDLFSKAKARQLSSAERPVRTDRLHLLLSRELPANAERMKDFNKALKAMRREGVIERILVEALGDQLAGVKRLRPDQRD